MRSTEVRDAQYQVQNQQKTRTIYHSGSKQYMCLTIQCKAKVKGDIKVYSYAYNIITNVWNGLVSNTYFALVSIGLVEVSLTDTKVALVGLDHDLSILTEYSATSIDLRKDDVISHQKYTSLLHIYARSLLTTAQDNYFDIAAYDVDNYYSGK